MNKIEVAIYNEEQAIRNAKAKVSLLQKEIEVRSEVLQGLERINADKHIPHEEVKLKAANHE
jgi:hypothetical protein